MRCHPIIRISHYFRLFIFAFSDWIICAYLFTMVTSDLHLHACIFQTVHSTLETPPIFNTLFVYHSFCLTNVVAVQDLRWSSQTPWKSDCRCQEKWPHCHASTLSLSSMTKVFGSVLGRCQSNRLIIPVSILAWSLESHTIWGCMDAYLDILFLEYYDS